MSNPSDFYSQEKLLKANKQTSTNWLDENMQV